jgi:hypothetical protein
MVSSTFKPSSQQLLCLDGGGCNLGTARRRAAVALLVLCNTAAPVYAQTTDIAQFFAGAALGLGAHEAGHLVFDIAFRSHPGVRKVSAGFIPFFAITHEQVTPVKEFTISSAGFWVQHAGDEFLLSRRPGLRHEHAPLAKGLLAFNVLTSIVYAGAAFSRHGPAERDTNGMALAADMAEPWIGASVLAPAIIDTARYFHPHSRALVWASRGTKVAGALLVIRAATRE